MNKQIILMTLVTTSLLASALSLISQQSIRAQHDALLQKMARLEQQQPYLGLKKDHPSQTTNTTDFTTNINSDSTAANINAFAALQTEINLIKQQLARLSNPTPINQTASNSTMKQNSTTATYPHSPETLALVTTLKTKTYLSADELTAMSKQATTMTQEDNKLYLETLFAKLGQESFELYETATR